MAKSKMLVNFSDRSPSYFCIRCDVFDEHFFVAKDAYFTDVTP